MRTAVAPLDQLPGSPFIADRDAAWYTDFRKVARLDTATGLWSVQDLPFPPGAVDGVAMLPGRTGSLIGVAMICTPACGDEASLRRVEVWRSGVAASTQVNVAVPLDADPNSYVSPLGARDGFVHFRLQRTDDVVIISVRDNEVTTQQMSGSYSTVCLVDGRLQAVQLTAGGVAGRRGVVAASLGDRELEPIALDRDQQALLDDPGSAAMCRPEGLSLVGSDRAYDFGPDGRAALARSTSGAMPGQIQIGLAAVSGKVEHYAGTVRNVEHGEFGWRSTEPDGPRLGPAPTGFAEVNGELRSYPFDLSSSDAAGK